MYHYYTLGIILEDLHALTVLILTTAYEAFVHFTFVHFTYVHFTNGETESNSG